MTANHRTVTKYETSDKATDTNVAYVVITEVNGYKNIYGHVLYKDPSDAEAAARAARESGCWEYVCMTAWPVV